MPIQITLERQTLRFDADSISIGRAGPELVFESTMGTFISQTPPVASVPTPVKASFPSPSMSATVLYTPFIPADSSSSAVPAPAPTLAGPLGARTAQGDPPARSEKPVREQSPVVGSPAAWNFSPTMLAATMLLEVLIAGIWPFWPRALQPDESKKTTLVPSEVVTKGLWNDRPAVVPRILGDAISGAIAELQREGTRTA